MECPICEKLGQESMVYIGARTRTTMAHQVYYDKAGKIHHHDPNVVTDRYSCSRRHGWAVRSCGTCWCGWAPWPEGEPKTAVTKPRYAEEFSSPP